MNAFYIQYVEPNQESRKLVVIQSAGQEVNIKVNLLSWLSRSLTFPPHDITELLGFVHQIILYILFFKQ